MSLVDKVNKNLEQLLGRTPTPDEITEYVCGVGRLITEEYDKERTKFEDHYKEEIRDADQYAGAI